MMWQNGEKKRIVAKLRKLRKLGPQGEWELVEGDKNIW